MKRSRGTALAAVVAGLACAPRPVVRARPPLRLACAPGAGLARPLPACTPQRPCDDAQALRDGRLHRRPQRAPTEIPFCLTTAAGRPFFDDGEAVRVVTPDGPRHACVHRPTGTAPRPLVVWFHGSFGGAANVYDHTRLRERADAYDLTGEASRRGYVLASVQARNLHWPAARDEGPRFDHLFRDAARNPDVRFVDRLVDALVSEGGVDRARVYVMGWGSGATFANAYAILRHVEGTPGGTRVAAGALYGASDPYDTPDESLGAACALRTYPRSPLPVFLLHRNCDAVAPCGRAQRVYLHGPPGGDIEQWAVRLGARVGASVDLRLIDDRSAPATGCAMQCNLQQGQRNHTRWPDGADDTSGHDWEPAMLDFLRGHPLR